MYDVGEDPEVAEELNEAAKVLRETIPAGEGLWKYAYFWMIWSPGSAEANSLYKFRWVHLDGTVVGGIHPPKPVTRNLDQLGTGTK